MKSFLYFLLAGSLALGACGQDPLQEMTPDASTDNADGSASGVPEGTFLVDYSVDNGSATRATGDGKLQISSLDYYVYYKAGGELLKHRRIAIDPEKQVWPMTRENMTWEQRQALQDTLQCGVDYRILFIANVDSTLFNYDGYDKDTNPHPAVVKGDTLYHDARILLPNVPFHDNNMYCLWEGELAASTDAAAYYDQAVINRNDILLQRIVTRTDISRASDEEETSLYDAIAKGFYKTECEEKVETAVNTWIDDFCEKINDCASYDIAGGHSITNSEMKKLEANEEAVKELTSILIANKASISAYIKDKLIEETYIPVVQSLYQTHVVDWSTLTKARVNYDANQRANSIGFDLVGHNDSGVDNFAPCDLAEGKIRFYGFERSGLNAFSVIEVTSNNTVPFTFQGESCNTNQTKNTHCDVTCDPVHLVNCKAGVPTQSVIELYDLTEALKNVEAWDTWKTTYDAKNTDVEGGITTVINYFFTKCGIGHAGNGILGNDGYDFENENYSLSSFPFEITRPNLTEENVSQYIELESAWKKQP